MTDKKYKELVETLKVIVWSADMDGTSFTFVSKEAEATLGYSIEEWLQPKFWANNLHPDDRKEIIKEYKDALKSKSAYELEYRMIAKNGEIVWFRNIINISKKEGQHHELNGIKINITQQKSAELIKIASFKIAAKAQRRLTNIKTLSKLIYKELNKVLDASSFYIALYNEKTNMISFPFRVDAYARSQKVFDSRKFTKGLTEYVISTGKPLFLNRESLKDTLNSGQGILSGDLPQYWLGVPIKSEGRTVGTLVTQNYDASKTYYLEYTDLLKFIAAQVGNIIDREGWQESIIRNEERLLDAQQAAKVGSWEWNIDTKSFWWSGEVYHIFGESLHKFQPTLKSFFKKIYPEDIKLLKEKIKAVEEDNKLFELEHRIILPDNSLRYVIELGNLKLDKTNKPTHLIGTIQDITVRKEVEISLRKSQRLLITEKKETEQKLQRLYRELTWQYKELGMQEEELTASNSDLLRKQDKLEATLTELSDRNYELDQLIYKTTHDLRSPLTSVLGLVNIMKYEDDVKQLKEYLIHIEQKIIKLDEFVKSMLGYAKANRSKATYEKIDFDEVINSCIIELEYLPDFHKVKQHFLVSKDVNYFGDSLRLKLIFANIISNAYKYLNPYTETNYLQIKVESKENSINISFKDNGIGIKADYLDKIFDMFFRAADYSQGSGLGLYLVKQTIDKLNGSIKVESKPNKGTQIFISLPIL